MINWRERIEKNILGNDEKYNHAIELLLSLIRAAKEEAWDEGHNAGYGNSYIEEHNLTTKPMTNPYRESEE